MKRALTLFLAIGATALFSASTQAEIFITYGRLDGSSRIIDLRPDTAGQQIQLFATGFAADGGADGLELDVQIGDGGTAIGGTDTGPVIQGVDLITGTVWGPLGPNQQDVVATPLATQTTVDTTSLNVADGLIGTITIDTTGFDINSPDISFRLTNVAGSFNTTFFQGASTLDTVAPDAVIRMVPEPGSALILAGLGLVGIGIRRKRA